MQSYTTVGSPSNVSINIHWICQQAANRKTPYIDLSQKKPQNDTLPAKGLRNLNLMSFCLTLQPKPVYVLFFITY